MALHHKPIDPIKTIWREYKWKKIPIERALCARIVYTDSLISTYFFEFRGFLEIRRLVRGYFQSPAHINIPADLTAFFTSVLGSFLFARGGKII